MIAPTEQFDALLPKGVGRQAGPALPPPADFGDGYVLPAHCEKPLERVRPRHDLDARLHFYEEPHIYTLDGIPTTESVTGLAHRYESPFVPAEAIKKMKSSKGESWPRLQYVLGSFVVVSSEQWSYEYGALLYDNAHGKTVASMSPLSVRRSCTAAEAIDILFAMRKVRQSVKDDCELYGFDRAMTDDEIVAAWARNGTLQSHKGTEAHFAAECFFNGMPFRWWEAEMQVLLRFCVARMLPSRMVAVATEREIVHRSCDLAGSIDLIVWDPTCGKHHIIDFKRTEKLKASLRGFAKMKRPFSHLDDCKGAAYALQLSLYQFILETEYGMEFADRVLLALHEDAPFATSVPYLKSEVEFLMQEREQLVRARAAVARRDASFRCALTGAPVVDAVRLDGDGSVVMARVALVRDAPHAAHFELRATFEAAVDAELAKHPRVTALRHAKPWRTIMPEEGLLPFSDR